MCSGISKSFKFSALTIVFSATGSLPESSSDFPKMSILENYSIDTSRAKSNVHVVSMCATKLGMEEYPEGRNDGKPCSIYWHSIVYGDMKVVVKSPDSRVNKFPGELLIFIYWNLMKLKNCQELKIFIPTFYDLHSFFQE